MEGCAMRKWTTVTLQKKEIINLCDGTRLGYATDFEFDPKCAAILSLMVPQSSGFCSFGKTEYLFIPWNRIECFGEDTILVRMSPEEISCLTMPLMKDGKGKCKCE